METRCNKTLRSVPFPVIFLNLERPTMSCFQWLCLILATLLLSYIADKPGFGKDVNKDVKPVTGNGGFRSVYSAKREGDRSC